jgi:hypothetical protein
MDMRFEEFINHYKASGKRNLFSQLINDILKDKEFPKGMNNERIYSYVRFKITMANGSLNALEKMVDEFTHETGEQIENMPLTDYINAEYNFAATTPEMKQYLEPLVKKIDWYNQVPQGILFKELKNEADKIRRQDLFKEIKDGYARITESN